MAGLGMLLFLSVLITASRLADPQFSLLGGTHGADLIPSYMAGSFVRKGRPDKLMNFSDAARFQAHLRRINGLEQNGRTGPWLNPPWFAALFVPLSTLPFPAAQLVWLTFNLLLLTASIILLCRMVARREPASLTGAVVGPLSESFTPGQSAGSGSDQSAAPDSTRRAVCCGWRVWGLVPLLLLTSMPFIQALASQQNTFLSLFLLTATVSFWRKGNGLRAGLVAGLLLFKPQLAAVVAVALTCSLGWRAILGLAITSIALLLSTALTMPGALSDYVHKLPAMLPWLRSDRPYAWERQVTFQGFWRLLLQGRVTGPASLSVQLLWPACAAAAGAMLLPSLKTTLITDLAVQKARGTRRWRLKSPPRRSLAPFLNPAISSSTGSREGTGDPISRDRLIAATIAIMPLLMPYYMDYDLLLLAVPAVLLAAERSRAQAPPDRASRALVIAWAALFPWLFVNAEFGAITRVSLTVLLLTVIAGLHAYRAACSVATAAGTTRSEATENMGVSQALVAA
jgi:hypothetical protein